MQEGLDVVVVGSANVDLVVRVVRRPGSGETVRGEDLLTLPGGKGANQAVAAALLGARTAFIGCIGEDDHGRLLVESLSGSSVSLDGLRRVARPTGTALIVVDEQGENSIVISPGANALIDVDDATCDAVAEAACVLLQREIAPEVSLAAAERAGGLVILNLAPSEPVPEALLRRTDVLVVNELEAAALLGLDHTQTPRSAETMIMQLAELGPDAVVITRGARGAMGLDEKGHHQVPAPPVEVVDTTGAGDAFVGALAVGMARGEPLGASMELAVRAGAYSVTKAGTQPSYPRPADLS